MERVQIPVYMKFEAINGLNPDFTAFKTRILAIGKNRNMSYFSKESVEKAIDSFRNLPIIAKIYSGDDGNLHIAGHEFKVEEHDGKIEYKTECTPYGVIPDGDFYFEEVEEPNGTKATYLTTTAVLWTGKYPEIVEAAYQEDESYFASMEINVSKAVECASDRRYTDIVEFYPTALTLLGKSDNPDYTVLPCFPSAGLTRFSFDEHFSALFEEMKFALKECFANKSQNTTNGGEKEAMENENFEVVDQIEETVEEVQEEVVEEVREEFEEQSVEETTEDVQEEQFEEQNTEDAEKEEKTFSSLYSEKRNAISDAVHKMSSYDYTNDKAEYFWLCDFDDEYAYVEHYMYDQNGEDKGVGRFAYSFNEDEKAAYLTGNFEVMYIKWLTADQLAEIENKNREFEALVQFKTDRLAEIHEEEVNDILGQFEDLNGNEEFEALKETACSYEDLEALSDKCFSIRGKAVKPTTNKKSNNDFRMPVRHIDDKASSRYGNLFETYNNKD